MKLICAAVVFATIAQGQPPQRPAISSTATAILVDAVVRDKSGQLVTDLSATDFELFEDGARQTIDSFTRVTRGGGIGVGVAWKTPDRTIAITPTRTLIAAATAIVVRTPSAGSNTKPAARVPRIAPARLHA